MSKADPEVPYEAMKEMNIVSIRKENWIQRNRHLARMLVMVFFLTFAFLVSIFVSSYLFNRSTREIRENIINKAAKLAITQIDADKIDQWLEFGPDASYEETAEILQRICDNTPYVQYLYVYQIRPDGCHVVFDADTNASELEEYDELPEISSDSLGDLIEFDACFADEIPTLLEGGQIDVKESNDTYGWLLTKYEPIYDSTGKCVAYVGIDISMLGISKYNNSFLKWMVAISAFFLFMLIISGHYYYKHVKEAENLAESERRREQQHILFQQTAEALAGAIDAKDKYTNGHSHRVAEYSRMIARSAGKTEEECDEVYFTALLHDVGKIGIPNSILGKPGRLSDEEFEHIKQHPVIGGNILSSIKESPWLSIGARYHHERYDGRGYPEGLKGTKIPEIARIVAIADAYDAMTSNRSYRSAIPQHIVREEFVKGIGSQFDPDFARIMISMIDTDIKYNMQERMPGESITKMDTLQCKTIYHDCSDGIQIVRKSTIIRLCSQPEDNLPTQDCLPTLILFDSLDGKVHPGEENNKNLMYFEYARIRLDGQLTEGNVRKSEVRLIDGETDIERAYEDVPAKGQRYKIEAARNRDHMLIHVSTEAKMFDVIVALPDTARFSYLSVSGEHCEIHNLMTETDLPETVPDIPRIADEISYTKGCPIGDIQNIEVDGPRFAVSQGIPVCDGMTLSFHTMSYPTARLVWHCPYFCIFTSENGQVYGENYHEYLLLRLDGEYFNSSENVDNKINVEKTEDFKGWRAWTEQNKHGFDCTVHIRKQENQLILQTENVGVAITSVSTFHEDVSDIYIALTGDQCAVTNIRIKKN